MAERTVPDPEPVIPRKRHIDRNRFVVLLSIALAFIASVIKTIWASFPIVEFLTFLGPVALGAYGIKNYRDSKENADNVNSPYKNPCPTPLG